MIMTKYEFKKFPILATVVTIIGLLAAIISISISLVTSTYDGFAALALLEIVATVLALAGLTTGKVTLLRVISIIMTVGILVTAFFLAIAKYADRDGFLFAVSLLMLVGSVLSLVYFLTVKNPRIEKMYFVASIVMLFLVVLYTVIYLVKSFDGNYSISIACLLLGLAAITVLPVSIYISMTKVEIPDEPKEEETAEEVNEENKETADNQ